MSNNAKCAVYALCGTAIAITVLILCFLANPGQFS